MNKQTRKGKVGFSESFSQELAALEIMNLNPYISPSYLEFAKPTLGQGIYISFSFCLECSFSCP